MASSSFDAVSQAKAGITVWALWPRESIEKHIYPEAVTASVVSDAGGAMLVLTDGSRTAIAAFPFAYVVHCAATR